VAGLHSTALQLRTAGRLIRVRGVSVRGALSALDERMVFVFGCPRSGTTFLAGAIGSCPEFVDLGEVAALKAAVAELTRLRTDEAARRIRRLLVVTRRLGFVGGLRAVEQTPETAFVAPAVKVAMPRARLVHVARDGRDVVCSLLERGWLSAGRGGADDAGLPYGAHGRFWVEPGREAEFEAASDARRAAWAWRRYVTAATAAGDIELRYERLAADPRGTAEELADALGAPADALVRALGHASDASVGRYRRDLSRRQLAEVEAEAGDLLRSLGYLQ
jgi:sulfotransferase family protein